MAIKIIDEDTDLYLTAGEYARLFDEYKREFMFYAGTPPTLEQWIKQRKGSVTTTNFTSAPINR